MKVQLIASCLLIGPLLAPAAALAEDRDSDRTHPMNYVEDSAITAKIKAKLAEEKMSSLAHIRVDTDNKGAVVLSGTVRSQEELDRAVSIAHRTEGVTSVKSELKIRKDD
jgi:hyperosmotically inducible protein